MVSRAWLSSSAHSIIGFDPKKRIAVVVLHNSGGVVDDIGFHLLDQTIPLSTQTPARVPQRKEVTVAPQTLAAYAGQYRLGALALLTVTVDGDIVCVQLTGQSKARVYPQSETAFFMKIADVQIDFSKDSSGAVTGLVLHQNGREVVGKRQ